MRALIHVLDQCGCMCAPVSVYPAHMRHRCENPGMFELCVFLFSRHIHETKLENVRRFANWLHQECD